MDIKHILTDDEKFFLSHQKLSIDDVFDGRTLSQAETKKYAKEQEKIVVIGSQCKKEGHRLRTRSGHCIQCDTSKIAYSSAHSQSGYVYIAASFINKLIKIGRTKSINERKESLNIPDYKYAGIDDLRIIYWINVENYGEVESKTLSKLKEYQKIISYKKGSDIQDAHEIFQCSFSVAKNALNEALEGKIIRDSKMLISDIRIYDWKIAVK